MSQINPNSSRFDQIKKLFHISTKLIDEFGFSYYLRVAFRELRIQKGSLFMPKILPVAIKNEFTIEYDDFLKTLQNKIMQSTSKIQNFTIRPLFSLILFIDADTPPIQRILDDQVYDNFELILISSSKKQIDSFISQNNILNKGINLFF